MKQGYVKIYRKFEEWEWYNDTNTFRVFFHLLIHAEHKDGKFNGHEIPTGSLVIGRKALSSKLGISERQVRTALSHLKSTNEITIKTTNKFSICTIVNWSKYQSSDQQDGQQNDQQVTNKRPTNDQQTTTSKEVKKLRSKEVKNKTLKPSRTCALDYSSWPSLPSEQTMTDWLAMRKRLKANVTQTVINRLAKKLKAATDAGYSVDDCIATCVERNWKGFDVMWMNTQVDDMSGYTKNKPKWMDETELAIEMCSA